MSCLKEASLARVLADTLVRRRVQQQRIIVQIMPATR
jgi:hypothetical protein